MRRNRDFRHFEKADLVLELLLTDLAVLSQNNGDATAGIIAELEVDVGVGLAVNTAALAKTAE